MNTTTPSTLTSMVEDQGALMRFGGEYRVSSRVEIPAEEREPGEPTHLFALVSPAGEYLFLALDAETGVTVVL